jgi:Cu2+-exporting ATPase
MSCCAPGAELALELEPAGGALPSVEEIRLASLAVGDGLRQTDLSAPGIHCGACIHKIETALGALGGVVHARVNLSTKRVAVRWREAGGPPPMFEALGRLGYEAHLFDAGAEAEDGTLRELVRALAVAGFATANIMLLSVSVWSGAEAATRDLFHWISALVALPALAYSGRIFFRSAWRSLAHRQMNMDVPISVGVSLAFALSLYETLHHGEHAYFDASVSLLFFLLIGRTLDHVMRERARVAVKGLAGLAARGALVLRSDGTREYLPVGDLQKGMTILLAAGERVPVDALVAAGSSELDCSIVSGESLPRPASAGARVEAGTLNLTGPLTITATAAAKDSFLAEMVRLMEAAEGGRSAYRRVADRAAQLYSPVVHFAALIAFLGWAAATGDLYRAITIAIAVLIITCPCALGLAVPMVQVVAARRLFENGIMVKDGAALERLAEIDTVVFDKTGTLTLGRPRLAGSGAVDPAALALAASIAAHSAHPLSRALVAAARDGGAPAPIFDGVAEHPGAGLEATADATTYRLGRAEWALGGAAVCGGNPGAAEAVLSRDGAFVAAFRFDDAVRPDAAPAIAALAGDGYSLEIVSGDLAEAVRRLAASLGIDRFAAAIRPAEKAARLAALAASGHKVLMIGDGLNDAPALVAAHVSMAPATAADVGRNAADFVFLRDSLGAVPLAIAVARQAQRLIRQNFALAVAYNAIALPIAVAGLVTPLVAALAMSSSSILVVANALRLGARKGHRRAATTGGAVPPLAAAVAR